MLFFQTEVKFLGHIVSESGIKCDPEKIEAVKNWHTPTKLKEIQSFLGFAGCYRRFIADFSSCTSTDSVDSKEYTFKWDNSCEVAFQSLKDSLITAPMLAFPTSDGTYILDTDASQTGVGAVLSQIQKDGEERVIAYSSRTLNRAQRNYCTTKRELLAVVIFLCQFRHYLYGQKMILRTDHASLKWLINFKNPEGIIARWISIIDTYDIDIQHRKGNLHRNADGLSRKPNRKCKRQNCPDCTEMDPDLEYFENKEARENNNAVSAYACTQATDNES